MAKPLMAKATAGWLVDNTTISFKQIADFVGMHELEIQGIADGDVAQGVKGFDPVANSQLTQDEIDEGKRTRCTSSSSSTTRRLSVRKSGAARAIRPSPSGRTGPTRSCGW